MTLPPLYLPLADLLVRGLSDKEIAKALGRPYGTIKEQNRRLYRRLGVRKRQHAALILAKMDLNGKPLHVQKFSFGACGITCHGMALHLREEEAYELLRELVNLYPDGVGA